jgi:FkbM family methyltransferase
MSRRPLLPRARALAAFAATAASLGPTRRAAAKLGLVALAAPLKRRVPRLARAAWTVTVNVSGHDHRLAIADRSDLQVLEEILVRREYDLRLPREPELVIDLGAHVGVSVLFFHTLFPTAEICAVEPDPATFALLERNVGHLDRVRCRRAAAGPAPGAGTVVRDDVSWTSRVRPAKADGGDVEIVTLDDLTAEDDRVRLLKIDIEGDEWDVLRAGDLGRFSAIVGELHPASLPVGVDEFFALFDGFDVTTPVDPAGHGTFRAVRRDGRVR